MSPRQISRIKPQDVGRFSIDDENNLYWDGQIIHTPSVVKLSRFQNVAVILASLAAISSTAAAWTTYFRVARPQLQLNEQHAATPAPCTCVPQSPSSNPQTGKTP